MQNKALEKLFLRRLISVTKRRDVVKCSGKKPSCDSDVFGLSCSAGMWVEEAKRDPVLTEKYGAVRTLHRVISTGNKKEESRKEGKGIQTQSNLNKQSTFKLGVARAYCDHCVPVLMPFCLGGWWNNIFFQTPHHLCTSQTLLFHQWGSMMKWQSSRCTKWNREFSQTPSLYAIPFCGRGQ